MRPGVVSQSKEQNTYKAIILPFYFISLLNYFEMCFRLAGKGLEISIKLNYSVSLSSYKKVFCK